MAINRNCFSILFLFLLALSACQPAAPQAASTNAPILSPTITPPAQRTPTAVNGVRVCDYVPGTSEPAQIPSSRSQPAAGPSATPITFSQGAVDATVQANQMDSFNQIIKAINDHYFSLDFNGIDWAAIQAKYKAMIQNGLSQLDFYRAMSQMVSELGDNVSSFASPSDQATQVVNSETNFVGIGIFFGFFNENGQDHYIVNWVYSGGPADQAGIKSHDDILKVDGGPFLDANGSPRALGPAGTQVTLTVQTPGQAPRDVKMTRASVSLTRVVDDCLVKGTAVGYLRLLDATNSETALQTIEALKQMSAASPLQGLIIDLRGSSGSDLNNFEPILSLFASGNLGSFIAPRGDAAPVQYTTNPADIAGSQKLPLVVLQDQDTPDAPLFSGVLQLLGRARIVGQTANGHIYGTFSQNLSDGSLLSIANAVFQPAGKTADYWKATGVVPDVFVNGSWEQYSEANDPYLANAIDLLINK